MKKDKIQVIFGGLLHDVGKPCYRGNRNANHSISGYDFLKESAMVNDEEILNQVLYHHAGEIRKKAPKENSLAYITYIADNIASAADRRENDGEIKGYSTEKALEPVFNIINGNNGKYNYLPKTLEEKDGINYPIKDNVLFPQSFYNKLCNDIADCLRGIEYTAEYANSLLEIMEADFSFIPSSTDMGQIADVSLFDHCKITAALGSCIMDYLKEENITDYKTVLYKKATEFYTKNAFLLYSFDISGIQDFIYTISAKGSLKMLRSRSFYLEMLCEHYIDTILDRLELSRANRIYSGGGHGYILLPNTKKAKQVVDEVHAEVNAWFMENFKTSLYIAAGYALCSGNDLMNKDGKSYANIFKRVSSKISEEKSNRYSADDIIKMNNDKHQQGERECRICHRSDTDIHNGVCEICESLGEMSDDILERDFFVITKEKNGLPLPFNCFLIGRNRENLQDEMTSENYIRCYGKNKMFTGRNIATKLWVGDYHTEKEFTKLAKKSIGIDRVGVIRADVDNLGHAFVSGFDPKHNSLSRTATFSRKLSIFFKKHINTLLKDFGCDGLIVYSGGDDIFLVTSWSDAVYVAIMLSKALKRFTEGMLTISAGVGMYQAKYPVSQMATESGELENKSKSEGKNRITVFSDKNTNNERFTFTWDEFENEVIAVKKKCLEDYFLTQDEHGKNLLYNLLDYLRNISDAINLARFTYVLSRTEPDKNASNEDKNRYRAFSKQMYEWAVNKKDRLQLITAIYLYVYEQRDTQRSDF